MSATMLKHKPQPEDRVAKRVESQVSRQNVRLVGVRLKELDARLEEEAGRLERGETDLADFAWEGELERKKPR